MSLSRKRRRELRHLQANAQDLLDQQRIVLSHAGNVLHQAGQQARHLSDEVVSPRIGETIDQVRPAVDRGVQAARRAGEQVRHITAPLVAGALASTVRTLERIENQDVARQVQNFGERKGILAPVKKKRGAGGVIALGLGIAAAVGVGYAIWQAFRADDELWVSTESDL